MPQSRIRPLIAQALLAIARGEAYISSIGRTDFAIMSSWGCPHEIDNRCQKIQNRPCDPGMKGCVLYGRFTFADEGKNRPPKNGGTEEPEKAKPT